MDERTSRRLAGLVDSPQNQDGYAYDVDAVARPQASEARTAAMRAIERAANLPDDARSRLERLVVRDEVGADSSYVAAVSNPAYERAFERVVRAAMGDPTASLAMTNDEREAVLRVESAQMKFRALGISSGPGGGFAIPATIDPTIILSSDGQLNPLRQLARIETIAGNEWKGVSSEGVVASYDPEGAEVSDDTPTLAQPTAKVEMARCFVPASIEVTEDWPRLRAELARLFAESKDALEAEKFLAGLGAASDEPEGLLIGASIDVTTAATGTIAIGDVYAVKQALPPRFQGGARWVGSGATFDTLRRLVGVGDPDEQPVWSDEGPAILRKPAHEYPSMDSPPYVAGEQPLVVGDFRHFLIVDRVGMTIEVVPHLMGENRRPTGMRGFFAYWRNASTVLIANAFRTLRIKS